MDIPARLWIAAGNDPPVNVTAITSKHRATKYSKISQDVKLLVTLIGPKEEEPPYPHTEFPASDFMSLALEQTGWPQHSMSVEQGSVSRFPLFDYNYELIGYVYAHFYKRATMIVFRGTPSVEAAALIDVHDTVVPRMLNVLRLHAYESTEELRKQFNEMLCGYIVENLHRELESTWDESKLIADQLGSREYTPNANHTIILAKSTSKIHLLRSCATTYHRECMRQKFRERSHEASLLIKDLADQLQFLASQSSLITALNEARQAEKERTASAREQQRDRAIAQAALTLALPVIYLTALPYVMGNENMVWQDRLLWALVGAVTFAFIGLAIAKIVAWKRGSDD